MGDGREELEASVKLILALAYESPKATELQADLDYARPLVLAAPEMFELLHSALRLHQIREAQPQTGIDWTSWEKKTATIIAKVPKGESDGQ